MVCGVPRRSERTTTTGLLNSNPARARSGGHSWTFFLLSQNPEVEQSLADEIDAVLGDSDPTYEPVILGLCGIGI